MNTLMLIAHLSLAALPLDLVPCVDRAAEAFGVPRLYIELILEVEGGRPGMANANSNGTVDLGPMQINSHWLDELAGMGIEATAVRDDACTNVYVGTWILVSEWARAGGNWIEALARYHSPTPRHQERYLSRLARALEQRLSQ